MELRVQTEKDVHTVQLRPHEREEIRGPWAEVAPASTSPLPFVVVGMTALDREGGRVKVEVGCGPDGRERGVAEVRLPVDVPPFNPDMRGITEPILIPSGERIVARYVRLEDT